MSVRRTGHPLYTVDGVTIADTSQTISGESDNTASVSVSVGSGGSGVPSIVTAGNLGAAYTLNVGAQTNPQEVWLVGTLNANCTITVSNVDAGARVKLLLTQDGTGGRTVSVSDGVTPVAVTVTQTAAALSVVDVYSPDGTTLVTESSASGGGVRQQVALHPYFPPDGGIGWGFPDQIFANGGWYGGFILDNSATQNDEIYWDLDLGAGTWTATIIHHRTTNAGIMTVSLDGSTVGTVDTYNAATQTNIVGTVAGIVVPTSGVHRFKLKVATKNASSTGYKASIGPIALRKTA